MVWNWTEIGSLATAFGSLTTAVSVIVAACQISISRQQAVTQFEDSMTSQYRAIIKTIPIEALFGEEIAEECYKSKLDDFYRYIDLTNEQVILRKQNRIRPETWAIWRDGIETQLKRPAFKRAWDEIKQRSGGDFAELRRLETDFNADPRRWRPPTSKWKPPTSQPRLASRKIPGSDTEASDQNVVQGH